MNIDFLSQFCMPIIVGICLCVGYIVKKWVKDVNNKYIPTVCFVLGTLIALWINMEVTPETLLTGMVSGLASTGLYEMFRNYIEKGEENK